MTGMAPVLRVSSQELPAITLSAVLTLGAATEDGRSVEAIATPWFRIMEMIQRDPESIYQIDPRQWEEIIRAPIPQTAMR